MSKKLILFVGFCIFSLGIIGVSASNEKNTKTVTLFENQPISVNLEKSIVKNNLHSNIYKDEDENEYIYVDDKLVGFIKDREISSETNTINMQNVSQASANSIISSNSQKVMNLAENIIDSDYTMLSDYELTKTNIVESYGEINYVFTKEIDGYQVNDSITISLDMNGDLVSFVANRQGLFDNYKNITIDDNDVLDFIDNEINTNYSSVDYVIENQIIDFVNNQLVLANYIRLEYPNYISSTILYYDL